MKSIKERIEDISHNTGKLITKIEDILESLNKMNEEAICDELVNLDFYFQDVQDLIRILEIDIRKGFFNGRKQ